MNTLRIPDYVRRDLEWYVRGDYRGELGERSTQGGIEDTLRRGILGERGTKDGGVTKAQLKAIERLRPIEVRIRRLSPPQRSLVWTAFGNGPVFDPESLPEGETWDAITRDLASLGPHPWAVLGAAATDRAWKASHSTHPLGLWVWRLTRVARRHAVIPEKHGAQLKLAGLVNAAMRELAKALAVYGARIEEVSGPDEVTVSELARALKAPEWEVRRRLKKHNVPVARSGKGVRTRVRRGDLQACWAEAAEALQQAA